MIKFTTNKHWSEKDIARRLTEILGFGHNKAYPFKKENGKWDVGGNDWWVDIETKDNQQLCSLDYRYLSPNTDADKEKIKAYETVLQDLFN